MNKYAFTFRQIKQLCNPRAFKFCDVAGEVYISDKKCSEKTCPLIKGKMIKKDDEK